MGFWEITFLVWFIGAFTLALYDAAVDPEASSFDATNYLLWPIATGFLLGALIYKAKQK